jgi:DNA gyrase subunit A
MNFERPDLSRTDPAVREYIEALEAELSRQRRPERAQQSDAVLASLPSEPSEPPTTRNLITISLSGVAKRTPRHLYDRQHRGGMGIFDLETPENDPPTQLVIADQSQSLVVITDQGRAFRLPVTDLAEAPVRSRGQSLAQRLGMLPGEKPAVVFPDSGGTYLVLVTQRGQVRRLRYHYFGTNLMPGTLMHDIKEGGPPAAACWTTGEAELFIATRKGDAIRFAERQVPVRGCLGIRVDPDDSVVAACPVQANSGVFLVGADGRGTVRLMEGFALNKAPGAGGKVALKTDKLIGAATVADAEDVLIISRLGKIIRFRADEVPAKEGVVQGVNCMALRADEVTAMSAAGGR